MSFKIYVVFKQNIWFAWNHQYVNFQIKELIINLLDFKPKKTPEKSF